MVIMWVFSFKCLFLDYFKYSLLYFVSTNDLKKLWVSIAFYYDIFLVN